ncbi:ATP-dependent nuclease [Hymenobacter psoromatis]|uniref:ATP-dependent nuclease n=1 Tax=Hymenobacter psoromatis TaxID=1484116 RepID=UPI001CBFD5A8|nr:ATP-binding protein [Hymenobacter psoromatis]
MVIKSLSTKNFRSLEDLTVDFNPHYNALSGKNNSGKSNIIRAMLFFLTFDYRILRDYSIDGLNFQNDYPHWKKKEREKEDIKLEIKLEIDENQDAGIYKFIKELIFKDEEKLSNSKETLTISLELKSGKSTPETKIVFGEYEVQDSYKREELLNRIRSFQSVLFHNSTENAPYYFSRRTDYLLSYLEKEGSVEIAKKKEGLENSVRKSLKGHQAELAALMGRLDEKYDVSLGISSLNIERENIEISLKEKGIDVSLQDWGSGTKNRTLILLNLMNAKRMQNSLTVNSKITPIVIIEEPESFLHPSAQAEFGRILQDLSSELSIQIIVATHSPYLLSHKVPKANILLERNLSSTNKGSEVIDTSGEKWYEPFSLSLGIAGNDFSPLKDTIFSSSNDIILVEGQHDKNYLELLKSEIHGDKRLKFNGEIFAYGGAGNIKNNILLRFIKERFKRFVVTVDLDKYSDVKSTFETLGLKENQEFIVIGKNETGKKCIEGLVPPSLLNMTYSRNVELVQKAMENSNDGKDARNQLKSKIFDVFKEESVKNLDTYEDFYKLSKSLNKLFK